MVKSIIVGNKVIGKLIATKGNTGIVTEIYGSGHKKKFKILWDNRVETLETNRAIDIANELTNLSSSSKRKKKHPNDLESDPEQN
jgi:hypothetical protein